MGRAHRRQRVQRPGVSGVRAVPFILGGERPDCGGSHRDLASGLDGLAPNCPCHVISQISFSPDGRLLAASSGDQTATLWDIQARKRVANPFPVEIGSIPVARFTPGGDLVIDNLTDTAQWPTDVQRWVSYACQVAGRDLTRAEWHDFLPNRAYRHVCPR